MNARTALLGLVSGLANAEYHALPALGSTGLRRMAQSPMHFRMARSIDPTPAMKAGTLAHCVLLEPGEVHTRYWVRPDGIDGRTKEGKALLATIPASLEQITGEQMDVAVAQANSARSLPDVSGLLSRGEAEQSAFWIDGTTGVHCKVRPDWVSPVGDDAVVLLDLKTTKNASPAGFPKSIGNFGYHLQAAHYVDGYAAASGKRVLGLVFVAVESDWPHAAAAYMLDDESLEKGRAECRRLLTLYAECSATNEWPGYPTAIQPITLPAWA